MYFLKITKSFLCRAWGWLLIHCSNDFITALPLGHDVLKTFRGCSKFCETIADVTFAVYPFELNFTVIDGFSHSCHFDP